MAGELKNAEKREVFIDAFCTHRSALKAARIAGYANPKDAAWRVRRDPYVKAKLKERAEARGMTADEAVAELAEIAYGSWASYIEPDGTVALTAMKTDGALHLVQSVTPTRDGVKVTFPDRIRALHEMGLFLGLLNTGTNVDDMEALLRKLTRTEGEA